MSLIEKIVSDIGIITSTSVIQTFSSLKVTGEFTCLNFGSLDILKKELIFFKNNEITFEIFIKNGEFGASCHLTAASIAEIDIRYSEFQEDYDDKESITLEINSNGWGKNIYIFNSEEFIKYLNSETMLKVITHLSEKEVADKSINFYFLEEEKKGFNNGYLNFIERRNDSFISCEPKESFDLYNEKIIELRDKASHFVNAQSFHFLPEYFQLDIDNNDKGLITFFNRLEFIFLLVFLSDYSIIYEDYINFKIKGYKTLLGKSNGRSIPLSVLNELRDIYKWAYQNGPFIDKIGIVRNVISIHISNDNIETLEVGTCASAESGYDLYLKENVKQYIEIKNKIADMLHVQSEKAGTIVKGMFDDFKKSIWTFITFFMTSIILRSIRLGQSSSSDMSEAVFFVGMILIFFSFMYIVFSRGELDSKKLRLVEKYREIENRYKELLNERDLQKILTSSFVNSKSPEEREIRYIEQCKRKYTIYWIGANILIIVCLLLFFNPWYSFLDLFEYIKIFFNDFWHKKVIHTFINYFLSGSDHP